MPSKHHLWSFQPPHGGLRAPAMAFFAWALATCSQDCKSLCCIVTAPAGWTQLNACHIPLTSSQSQVEKIFCRTFCSGTRFLHIHECTYASFSSGAGGRSKPDVQLWKTSWAELLKQNRHEVLHTSIHVRGRSRVGPSPWQMLYGPKSGREGPFCKGCTA